MCQSALVQAIWATGGSSLDYVDGSRIKERGEGLKRSCERKGEGSMFDKEASIRNESRLEDTRAPALSLYSTSHQEACREKGLWLWHENPHTGLIPESRKLVGARQPYSNDLWTATKNTITKAEFLQTNNSPFCCVRSLVQIPFEMQIMSCS